MSSVITPPNALPRDWTNTVFLAGSIDMGTASDWQTDLIQRNYHHNDAVFLNPRRLDWDSSWTQTIRDANFRGQVEWEMKGLANAETVLVYISKDSKAPITLMEIGYLLAKRPGHVLIAVEPGFYRRGNIEVMAQAHGVPVFDDVKVFDTFLDLKFN